MKQAAGLFGLGLLALIGEAALLRYLPVRFAPDLGLLVTLAFAIALRSPLRGLWLAAALGAATDVYSGSLPGQFVLVRVILYGVARFAAARLSLRRVLPAGVFAAGLALLQAALVWASGAFFAGGGLAQLSAPAGVLSQALATALCAQPLRIALEALASRWQSEGVPGPARIDFGSAR